jgi:hypothetical protein
MGKQARPQNPALSQSNCRSSQRTMPSHPICAERKFDKTIQIMTRRVSRRELRSLRYRGRVGRFSERLALCRNRINSIRRVRRLVSGDARCADCRCFSHASNQPIKPVTISRPLSARSVLTPKRTVDRRDYESRLDPTLMGMGSPDNRRKADDSYRALPRR